jgi:hypothetical protein
VHDFARKFEDQAVVDLIERLRRNDGALFPGSP